MTRLLLLLSLFASIAFGQTYVRPSKGRVITPYGYTTRPTDGGWDTWPVFGGGDGGLDPGGVYVGGPTSQFAGPWDWSAFTAMRIRIYGTGSGSNIGGIGCRFQSVQYTVDDIGSYVRLRLSWVTIPWPGTLNLIVEDSAEPSGTYWTVSTSNATYNSAAFVGCPITIQVTPLPFSPASVATASTTSLVSSDGGSVITVDVSNVATLPYACASTSPFFKELMDGGAVTIGGDAGIRNYIVVTNNGDDLGAGSVVIKCRADGTAPTLTAGSKGTLLSVGQSVLYSNQYTAPVKCIGGTTWVGAYECAP